MNWGHKITIVIVIFIISMLSMVFVAFKQTNEMIDKDYYNEEIKYQTLIDASRNLNAIGSVNLLTKTDENLVISIPSSLVQKFEEGKLELIKSSAEKDDRSFKITPDASGVYKVSLSKVPTGFYKARIWFTSDKKPYYREQEISLN